MIEILAFLDFAGYIALLLWGVHMVQSGVQRTFGATLNSLLEHALRTRLRAFLTGLGITAALQSSTATGLMITGFAAAGLVALTPALAVMLGANVGTTLVVQVLSFDLTAVAPVLVLLGVWLFRHYSASRRKELGRVFIGLGLLVLALHGLVVMFDHAQHWHLLGKSLTALADRPVVALLLATLLAWASHSSVAVVVLIMSLFSRGVIPAPVAYALVLGANLGASINPLVEGVTSPDPAARRLPLGNLILRIPACLIALLLLPWIPGLMTQLSSDPARAVANFHSLFNIVAAAVFLPVLKPYSRLLVKWLPERTRSEDPGKLLYLAESFHEAPAIMLGHAAREALRLSDMLQTLLQLSRVGLCGNNEQVFSQSRDLDKTITRLNIFITSRLAGLGHENLNQQARCRLAEILAFSSNMTHAADTIATGIMRYAKTLHKMGWALRAEQRKEFGDILDRLQRNGRWSAALFMSEDLGGARQLASEKEWFRHIEALATDRYLKAISTRPADWAGCSSAYLEILRGVKAVNSCLVAAAAYPILTKHGQLLPNRLGAPP